MNILAFENVHRSFIQGTTAIPVLSGITYTFESNTTYALVGVSGTGKSTLVYLAAGLDIPTKGTIYYNASNIHAFTESARRQYLHKNVGLILQAPYLLNELTVLENILVKSFIAGSRYHLQKQALDLLERVGLSHKADFYPALLSGGEQQRVALARALLTHPDFIIADEPTAHLDSTHRDSIIELLQEWHTQWGTGLIIASHDIVVSNRMHKKIELCNGQIRECTTNGKV